MPMQYESQSGTRFADPQKDALSQALSRIDGVDNSFATLTAPDQSYIQTGGGPNDFLLEIRRPEKDGSFHHFRAASSNSLNPDKRFVVVGGAKVSLNADQVFSQDAVRKAFLAFLADYKSNPAGFVWQDITSMFR